MKKNLINNSMNKDAKLLAEAYGEVTKENIPMPSTHGTPGYKEEEITLDQLSDYNSENDIEDVLDMLYKGVRSGQISYDTYFAFMKSFIS
jgi:hypothetical protein